VDRILSIAWGLQRLLARAMAFPWSLLVRLMALVWPTPP
jgi:hypothetical protein